MLPRYPPKRELLRPFGEGSLVGNMAIDFHATSHSRHAERQTPLDRTAACYNVRI
jgi:hypothetical protein